MVFGRNTEHRHKTPQALVRIRCCLTCGQFGHIGQLRACINHLTTDPLTTAEINNAFHDIMEAFSSNTSIPQAFTANYTGQVTIPNACGVQHTARQYSTTLNSAATPNNNCKLKWSFIQNRLLFIHFSFYFSPSRDSRGGRGGREVGEPPGPRFGPIPRFWRQTM